MLAERLLDGEAEQLPAARVAGNVPIVVRPTSAFRARSLKARWRVHEAGVEAARRYFSQGGAACSQPSSLRRIECPLKFLARAYIGC
jgi:hypothetical protein